MSNLPISCFTQIFKLQWTYSFVGLSFLKVIYLVCSSCYNPGKNISIRKQLVVTLLQKNPLLPPLPPNQCWISSKLVVDKGEKHFTINNIVGERGSDQSGNQPSVHVTLFLENLLSILSACCLLRGLQQKLSGL